MLILKERLIWKGKYSEYTQLYSMLTPISVLRNERNTLGGNQDIISVSRNDSLLIEWEAYAELFLGSKIFKKVR